MNNFAQVILLRLTVKFRGDAMKIPLSALDEDSLMGQALPCFTIEKPLQSSINRKYSIKKETDGQANCRLMKILSLFSAPLGSTSVKFDGNVVVMGDVNLEGRLLPG